MPVISKSEYSDKGNQILCQIHRTWESVTSPKGSKESVDRGKTRKALLCLLDKMEKGEFQHGQIVSDKEFVVAAGLSDVEILKEMDFITSVYMSSVEYRIFDFYLTCEIDDKEVELNAYSYFSEKDKSKQILVEGAGELLDISDVKVKHRLKVSWEPLA